MAPPPHHVLSEAKKKELLLAQHEMIERMAARITELEGLVGKPRDLPPGSPSIITRVQRLNTMARTPAQA